MQQSTLQLETSTFTKIRVEANKNFPKEKITPRFDDYSEITFQSTVEFGPSETDKFKYFVKLGLTVDENNGTQPPYIINIEIIGIFEIIDKNNPVDERIIEFNAPAVLYGSVREMVMMLTSRGPFPKLVLPTVNFINPDTKVDPDGKPSK